MTFIKRSAACLALLCGLAGVTWSAGTPGDFGVGVIIGDPTGLSAKWWTGHNRAVDMALAWDLSGPDDRFETHADYLWHFPRDVRGMRGRLPLYVGVGGRFLTGHDARIGVRVPFGVCYLFSGAPVEVFAEVAPLFDLTPDGDFSVNGGVGARYYFRP